MNVHVLPPITPLAPHWWRQLSLRRAGPMTTPLEQIRAEMEAATQTTVSEHYLAWCIGATPVRCLSGQVPMSSATVAALLNVAEAAQQVETLNGLNYSARAADAIDNLRGALERLEAP